MTIQVSIPGIDTQCVSLLIRKWHKLEGERVRKGDLLFELETEKASMEIESPCAGFLLERRYKEGQAVRPLTVAAVIGQDEGKIPESTEVGDNFGKKTRVGPPGKVEANPGKVPIVDDSTPSALDGDRDTARPPPVCMTGMRRAIARRMTFSKDVAPHFYVTVSVDTTDLLALRREFRKSGIRVSINDFVLKACAIALRDHPDVNSRTHDGINLIRSEHINIGCAVNLPDGLVVPVLRDTDKMSVTEVHRRSMELLDRATGGELSPLDLDGGTFTVSNMGVLSVENFAAIINPGESAILAVGAICPRPVCNDCREIAVRDMMKITLSADHRIIDGAMAASFINTVKRKLENTDIWRAELEKRADTERHSPGDPSAS